MSAAARHAAANCMSHSMAGCAWETLCIESGLTLDQLDRLDNLSHPRGLNPSMRSPALARGIRCCQYLTAVRLAAVLVVAVVAIGVWKLPRTRSTSARARELLDDLAPSARTRRVAGAGGRGGLPVPMRGDGPPRCGLLLRSWLFLLSRAWKSLAMEVQVGYDLGVLRWYLWIFCYWNGDSDSSPSGSPPGKAAFGAVFAQDALTRLILMLACFQRYAGRRIWR